jgi:hypothetical protein
MSDHEAVQLRETGPWHALRAWGPELPGRTYCGFNVISTNSQRVPFSHVADGARCKLCVKFMKEVTDGEDQRS